MEHYIISRLFLSFTSVLMETDMTVMSDESCAREWGIQSLPSDMVCAKQIGTLHSTCQVCVLKGLTLVISMCRSFSS